MDGRALADLLATPQAAADGLWETAAPDARPRYSFHAEPRNFEPVPDGGTVTAHLTGDFPGTPANLRYRFRLAGERVVDLEITLRDRRAEFTGRRVLVTRGGRGDRRRGGPPPAPRRRDRVHARPDDA